MYFINNDSMEQLAHKSKSSIVEEGEDLINYDDKRLEERNKRLKKRERNKRLEERNKRLEERNERLKEAIKKLQLFKQIDDGRFECKNDNFKTFLHILCPSHNKDIDDAINNSNKNKLQSIIQGSIFNELKGLLLLKDVSIEDNDTSVRIHDEAYKKNYIFLLQNNGPTSIERSVNGKDSISHCVDTKEDLITIRPLSLDKKGSKLEVFDVFKRIKTYNLTTEEEEFFEFTKTLSMSEVKVYLSVLRKILTEKRESNAPNDTTKDVNLNKEEIINAMKDAQKAVEKDRNPQKEKKNKKNKNKNVSFGNICIIDVESYKNLPEEPQLEENSNHNEDNYEEGNYVEGMEALKKRINQGYKNELANTKNNKINNKKEEELPSPETIISAMQKAQKTVEETRKKEEEKDEKKEEEDINNKPAGTNMDNAPRCFGSYKKEDGKVVYRCFGYDIPCL